MSWIVIAVVSLLSGLLGSLGMGAGAVLRSTCAFSAAWEQFEAQGINLIFFLPIAVLSILLHARNHLISWKAAGVCILAGLPAVFLGVWLGGLAGGPLLSKFFCRAAAHHRRARTLPEGYRLPADRAFLGLAAPERRSLSAGSRRRFRSSAH